MGASRRLPSWRRCCGAHVATTILFGVLIMGKSKGKVAKIAKIDENLALIERFMEPSETLKRVLRIRIYPFPDEPTEMSVKKIDGTVWGVSKRGKIYCSRASRVRGETLDGLIRDPGHPLFEQRALYGLLSVGRITPSEYQEVFQYLKAISLSSSATYGLATIRDYKEKYGFTLDEKDAAKLRALVKLVEKITKVRYAGLI